MTAGEIIQYCQEKGVVLTPKENGRLRFYGPREVITEEVLSILKAHKSELIQILTVMDVFNGVIVSDYKQALTSYKPILCPYNNQARYIHPEVCKWHREEGDPECERCGCTRARTIH
jgi:hypothetical protein